MLVAPAGHLVLALLEAGSDGPRLLARVTRISWDRLRFPAGDRVYAQIKGVALLPR